MMTEVRSFSSKLMKALTFLVLLTVDCSAFTSQFGWINKYRRSTVQEAYIIDKATETDGSRKASERKSISSFQTDFLGRIDFCLRPADNALSGPSRTKVLNEITNDVFAAIMIAHEPLIEDTLSKFPTYREMIETSVCLLERDSQKSSVSSTNLTAPIIDNCDTDKKTALTYVSWLEELLKDGKVNESMLGGIYDKGYKTLLTVLKDTGCRFPHVDNKNINRPTPIDKNICLSLLDQMFLDNNRGKNINMQMLRSSKTLELNKLSNVCVRSILYGSKKERVKVADFFENFVVDFANRWTEGDMRSQEVLFLQVLAVFLREDLIEAERASNYTLLDEETAETFDPFNTSEQLNAGSMTVIEQTKEEDYELETDVDIEIVENPKTPIKDLSSPTLQPDLPPNSFYCNTEKKIKTIKPKRNLRLFDTYMNAFHRVVEACVTEIGVSNRYNMPQNEEVLQSFLIWEQGLRRNLTVDLWKQNPKELAGVWEIVDVAGKGSLAPIMTGDFQEEGMKIEFTKDGNVDIKNPSCQGIRWYFKPGPAHLDTCEFQVASTTDPDLLLKYVGFIDRGQRIESRFSRLPIKMTGRVVAMVRGEARSSSRFIMVLKRKD